MVPAGIPAGIAAWYVYSVTINLAAYTLFRILPAKKKKTIISNDRAVHFLFHEFFFKVITACLRDASFCGSNGEFFLSESLLGRLNLPVGPALNGTWRSARKLLGCVGNEVGSLDVRKHDTTLDCLHIIISLSFRSAGIHNNT